MMRTYVGLVRLVPTHDASQTHPEPTSSSGKWEHPPRVGRTSYAAGDAGHAQGDHDRAEDQRHNDIVVLRGGRAEVHVLRVPSIATPGAAVEHVARRGYTHSVATIAHQFCAASTGGAHRIDKKTARGMNSLGRGRLL